MLEFMLPVAVDWYLDRVKGNIISVIKKAIKNKFSLDINKIFFLLNILSPSYSWYSVNVSMPVYCSIFSDTGIFTSNSAFFPNS